MTTHTAPNTRRVAIVGPSVDLIDTCIDDGIDAGSEYLRHVHSDLGAAGEEAWWAVETAVLAAYNAAVIADLETAGVEVWQASDDAGPDAHALERKFWELAADPEARIEAVEIGELATYDAWSQLDVAAIVAKALDPWQLHDADTAEPIGPASPEQIGASLDNEPTGHILIGADGEVIAPGAFGSDKARRAYVAEVGR